MDRNGEKRNLFLFTLLGAIGLDELFEVFYFGGGGVHKLEADIKRIFPALGVLVVGNDPGLDFPGRLAGGRGYFNHHHRSSAGVVVQKQMVSSHLELTGLEAGPFDRNRGKASPGLIGPGPPGERIPDEEIHIRADGMTRIPAAFPAHVFLQGFHGLNLAGKRIHSSGVKTPAGSRSPEFGESEPNHRLICPSGQYDKIPSSAGRIADNALVPGRGESRF